MLEKSVVNVIITLKDINDNIPVFGFADYQAAISENATSGTWILNVSVRSHFCLMFPFCCLCQYIYICTHRVCNAGINKPTMKQDNKARHCS